MIELKQNKRLVFQVVTLLTVFCFSWTFLLAENARAQVTVPAGQIVVVRTIDTLSPESLNIGDTVDLSVVNDVVVDGKTIIRAGAAAKGEIIQAKDRNFIGIAGKIGLVLQSVQAADGTTLPIRGTKIVEGKDKMVMSIGLSLVCCILFALIKGGEATLPAGTQIEAQTAATQTVNV